ncbi:MAG: bifunctional DNA primase/polymerase, partial [Nocardioidaceae bacterium]
MNDSTQAAARWSTSTMLRASASADLPTAAAVLAGHGIAVFPCVPGGKQPLTSHGFHDASSDLAQVQDWWRRSPGANIGLPTGHRSGVLVVDVDVHPAGTGYSAFERARAAGLVEGWGWLVRTPSGGLHAYYPPIRGAEQRSWQVPGEHVDFRGDGGYIIAPPSRVALTGGAPASYRVIAVAQHHPRNLDADRLRAFLD